MTAINKNRFAPTFESLEQREMLTAGATISACLDVQGTLLVNGTNGADRIAIRRTDSNTIGVYCLLGPQTGLVGNYNVHAVNNVLVNTFDGSDRVQVDLGHDADSARIKTALFAGNGDVELDGNVWGNNFLHAGSGKDTLRGGNGNDTLIAGNGDDLLEAMGTGNKTFYLGTGNDLAGGGSGTNIFHVRDASYEQSDYIDSSRGSNSFVVDAGSSTGKYHVLGDEGPAPLQAVQDALGWLNDNMLAILGKGGGNAPTPGDDGIQVAILAKGGSGAPTPGGDGDQVAILGKGAGNAPTPANDGGDQGSTPSTPDDNSDGATGAAPKSVHQTPAKPVATPTKQPTAVPAKVTPAQPTKPVATPTKAVAAPTKQPTTVPAKVTPAQPTKPVAAPVQQTPAKPVAVPTKQPTTVPAKVTPAQPTKPAVTPAAQQAADDAYFAALANQGF